MISWNITFGSKLLTRRFVDLPAPVVDPASVILNRFGTPGPVDLRLQEVLPLFFCSRHDIALRLNDETYLRLISHLLTDSTA